MQKQLKIIFVSVGVFGLKSEIIIFVFHYALKLSIKLFKQLFAKPLNTPCT